MVELLLKRLSEQYHIPMEDKTKEQQEAAEVRKTMENKNEKSMTLEEMISEMLKDARW